jgi:hypothetical protein
MDSLEAELQKANGSIRAMIRQREKLDSEINKAIEQAQMAKWIQGPSPRFNAFSRVKQ